MKNRFYACVAAAFAILPALVGCKNDEVSRTVPANPAVTAAAFAQPAAAVASDHYTGTVVEFINAGNYTYVRVDTGTDKIWAAAPAFKVKVGDKLVVPSGVPMKNYHSKSLGRTFDLVYFVPSVATQSAEPKGSRLPERHPRVSAQEARAPADAIDFSGIARPKGGKTVAEIYRDKNKLAGKEITIRAKVVKYNAAIMGKNWLHLRDGTGAAGTNDLTVTSDSDAKLGDTVVARGVLVTDKDFGYGYKYAVIIENAKITVE